MKKRAAVLHGENNLIAEIFDFTKIIVYEKIEEWEAVTALSGTGINAEIQEKTNIRKNMEMIISWLKEHEIKIIIGKLIVGIPYYMLDKNGFIVCEAENFSQELLEQIAADYLEKNEEAEKTEEEVPSRPFPVDNEGNYFLDFALLQKKRPEISSKKALLPFLSNELFQSLTVVCTHIMPWLDVFLEDRNLKIDAERKNGLYTVKISRKLCKNE